MSAEIKRTADLTDNDYARAVAIITGDNNASTSYLQRTMQLGYNAAASLIERAEAEGIVSRPNAAGKREVTPAASTIATLTAQLAEARAMAGAVIERAAQVAEDWWYDPAKDEVTDTILSNEIRALDPDASAALAEYVRPFKDRAEAGESLIAECAEYLKADETPRQRMDRDHANVLSLMEMLANDRTRRDTSEAEVKRLREAVTPSGDTKAAYMGEFSFPMTVTDEDGNEGTVRVPVPWDTIKEIMGAIRTRALLEGAKP